MTQRGATKKGRAGMGNVTGPRMRPCPFCGSVHNSVAASGDRVICNECDARGPIASANRVVCQLSPGWAAWMAWNRRY